MMKGFEDWATVAFQAPIDANAVDATLPSATTGIDMSLWSELLVLAQFGVINASATLTFDLRDSATTNGTYAAISGKTKTTGGSDDGFIWVIALNAAELNASARFVRLYQDNSAHSQFMSVVILGKAVNPPATDNKISAQQTVVD